MALLGNRLGGNTLRARKSNGSLLPACSTSYARLPRYLNLTRMACYLRPPDGDANRATCVRHVASVSALLNKALRTYTFQVVRSVQLYGIAQ